MKKSSECQTTHVMLTSSALKGFSPQEMLERGYMKSQRRVFVSPENILLCLVNNNNNNNIKNTIIIEWNITCDRDNVVVQRMTMKIATVVVRGCTRKQISDDDGHGGGHKTDVEWLSDGGNVAER